MGKCHRMRERNVAGEKSHRSAVSRRHKEASQHATRGDRCALCSVSKRCAVFQSWKSWRRGAFSPLKYSAPKRRKMADRRWRPAWRRIINVRTLAIASREAGGHGDDSRNTWRNALTWPSTSSSIIDSYLADNFRGVI